jgi:hypothetical protein
LVTGEGTLGIGKLGRTNGNPAVHATPRERINVAEIRADMDLVAAPRAFKSNIVLKEQKGGDHTDNANDLIQTRGGADDCADNSANDEDNERPRKEQDPQPDASAPVLLPGYNVRVRPRRLSFAIRMNAHERTVAPFL